MSGSVPLLNPRFEGRISSYRDFAERMIAYNADRPFRVFKCVCPSWDNEARKPGKGYVLTESTPALYQWWLDAACSRAAEDPVPEARVVFINAWNEWGEGAYLEPDLRFGYAYLESTKQVVKRHSAKRQRLSVIVPNYNHAQFLERRLISIVSQTRRPDEILFLDDASTDDSMAIARRILATSGTPYTIVTNAINSGSVFRQWLTGIERATGELIWIAESDDDADQAFLAALLPEFDKSDVLLAYGQISYINADGSPNTDLDSYYDDLPGNRWHASQRERHTISSRPTSRSRTSSRTCLVRYSESRSSASRSPDCNRTFRRRLVLLRAGKPGRVDRFPSRRQGVLQEDPDEYIQQRVFYPPARPGTPHDPEGSTQPPRSAGRRRRRTHRRARTSARSGPTNGMSILVAANGGDAAGPESR